jgi:hypothetical protein
VHLALEGSTRQMRTELYRSLQALAQQTPTLTNQVVRDGVQGFLLRQVSPSKNPAPLTTGDDSSPSVVFNKHSRLSTLLGSVVTFDEMSRENIPVAQREELVVELLILAHHAMICAIY